MVVLIAALMYLPARVDVYGDPLPPGAAARCGTVRWRVPGMAGAVAWAPDGNTVAAAAGNGVHLIDPATGLIRRCLYFRHVFVPALAFAPDGKSLVAASERELCLWDLKTGERLARFPTPGQGVVSMAWSADCKRFAIAGTDRIDQWDVATRKRLPPILADYMQADVYGYTPDGKSLYCRGPERTVSVRDPATGNEIRRITGKCGEIRVMCLSRDGRLVALVEQETVRVCHRQTLVEKSRFDLSKGVLWVDFSPDGRYLVAGGGVDGARVWRTDDGTIALALRERTEYYQGVAVSPDGKTLIFGRVDGVIRVIDIATGADRNSGIAQAGMATRVVWSPDGKLLASGDELGAVRLWNASSGRLSHTLIGKSASVCGLAFAPDGRTLASSSAIDPQVRLWDVASGKGVRTLLGGEVGVSDVAFSPDGRTLATASALTDDRSLKLWEATTGRLLRSDRPIQAVGRIAFAPDGQTVAGLYEGLKTVRFWNTRADAEPAGSVTTPGHESLLHLEYSPDGNLLALCGGRPSVDLWNPVTRTFVTRLEWVPAKGRRSLIGWRCAFSPDGRLLAAAGPDDAVRVWEIGTRQQVLRFEGHRGPVVDVAFAPDGLALASASDDGTALVWDMALKAAAFPAPDDAGLWDQLASPNAALAYRAVCVLAADPDRAVMLLRAKLAGGEDRGVRVRRLIADLDSPRYAERERATKELARMDVEAELRAALAGPASPEVRRRAEGVLSKLADAGIPPEAARLARSVMVLERINSPAGRKLLEELVRGEPGRDAKAALDRLARRAGR